VKHVGIMGNSTGAYKVMVGKPEEKRPLGRPWLRWEDNTKKDLKEIGWYSINWIYQDQGRNK